MIHWFDHILLQTRVQPETPAIAMEDRVVTYGMLGIAIENCARRIATLEIPIDGLVAVCVQNPIRHFTLCLALYQIGIRSMSLEHGQAGIANLSFAAVLGDSDAQPLLDPANRFIDVTEAWFSTDHPVGGNGLPAGFSDHKEICHYALTSGATGARKTFGCTIEYVGRHVPLAIIYNCRFVLCMLGLSSAWGFLIACATLATGKTLCFATSPYQAVRMIELFSIDYFMASYDQLVSITRAARKLSAQLKSLRTIVAGGSVPSRALLEAAAAYVCKDIICRYGTTELGLVADAPAGEVLSKPGLIGRVVPDVELAVFNPRGGKLSPGEVGIIKGRIKSWIGSLPDDRVDEHAWIDVGDVGWMTANNQFYVVGRTSDITIARLEDASAWEVSSANEVEHLLRLEWDAADAAAVIINDEAGRSKPEIWVGTVDCKDASPEKLEAILRQRGIEGAVRLFSLSSIPRAANGKVQRSQLKALMLSSAGKTPGP
jgi:acyl-CoA synthetase (AMP-forming)/AMP-acid ligase II